MRPPRTVRADYDGDMRDDPQLLALAASQYGHVTAAQASRYLTPSQVHRRVVGGIWVRVQPNVLRHASAEETWRGRAWAATAKPGVVAARGTAAALHRLDRAADHDVVHVVVEGDSKPRLWDVAIHRTSSLPPPHVGRRDGIPVTSLPRTVIDLARRATWVATCALVDDALCLVPAGRSWFARTAEELIGQNPAARYVLDITCEGAEGSFWSWLERTAGTLWRNAGLPQPRWNRPIVVNGRRIAIVDAVWLAQRVIADLIGLRFHQTTRQRQRDADVARELGAWFRILPYTYVDLVERPDMAVRTLSVALATPGAPSTSCVEGAPGLHLRSAADWQRLGIGPGDGRRRPAR